MSRYKRLGIIEALGLILSIVGTGVQLRWPEQKWLGTVIIVAGVAVMFGVLVWWMAQRAVFKEIESQSVRHALPAQRIDQSVQVPISNSPTFTFAPTITQSHAQEQASKGIEPKNTRDPVLECRGTRLERWGFNTQTGELIRERYEGDPTEMYSYIRLVDVALAKFYFRPDVGVDPLLSVQANIFFRNRVGDELEKQLEIYGAIWDDDEHSTSKDFWPGGRTHELIVALIPAVEPPQDIIGYEYDSRQVTTYMGSEYMFTPRIHDLQGEVFLIMVELIPKRGNEVRSVVPPFLFTLSLSPKPVFRNYPSANRPSDMATKG